MYSKRIAVAVLGLLSILVSGQPSPPAPCGTLDLTSPLTQHCFPADGSHHFVCCVDIQMPDNSHSPHGNFNPLERVIKAASNSTSWSWCTCSEEICRDQLGGTVLWNQNGMGHSGYLPPIDGDRPLFNAATGLK
ncbi:hypothetical protein NADE_008509 [Nannochloris sp. 'desiccata']|nr:hypothetical protein NADE_008509 [Chlorella desiccata (nom. nud.)]